MAKNRLLTLTGASLLFPLLLCSTLTFAKESQGSNVETENAVQTEDTDENPDDAWNDGEWGDDKEPEHTIHGFIEAAYGARIHSNPWLDRDDTLNEARLRIEYSNYFGALKLPLKQRRSKQLPV